MMGRNCKFFDDDPDKIDCDTASSLPQIRASGIAIEVLALKGIVEEIMMSDDAVITSHQ